MYTLDGHWVSRLDDKRSVVVFSYTEFLLTALVLSVALANLKRPLSLSIGSTLFSLLLLHGK